MGYRQGFLASVTASLLLACTVGSVPTQPQTKGPTVQLKNGTYQGLYSPGYEQDFFLGVPFAQPPLGPLRLNNPQPLNGSFTGVRSATQFGPICVGYIGSDDWPYKSAEDCLTINIIRPHGTSPKDRLPVATWMYGGGYYNGGSADQRYNLSFIVQNSVEMGRPIMGVSFNYRVAQWGFLSSDVIQKAGVTNLGLKDQRLALHWIQENIAAFGGDPHKVTIWGESAGGGSVAYQSILYGGRNDHLYRGIISESMYQEESESNTTMYNMFYEEVTKAAGCGSGPGSLACLRKVPFDKLNQAFNSTAADGAFTFGPVIDGDTLTELFSQSFAQGKFTHTPILIGQNTDEGTAFGAQGINTTAQFATQIATTGLDAQGVAAIERLYPDDPAVGIPATTYPNRPPPGSPLGQQWKRVSAFYGDYVMHAPRRYINQMWTQRGVPSYAYRFNALPNGVPDYIGVTHFQEVAFVFDNIHNDGYYEPISSPPFENRGPRYTALAKLMSRMWVSFVHDLDPNNHGIAGTAHWPAYASTKVPQDFVFDANVTSHAENDTYRAAGIKWINDHAVSQFHR